MIYEKLKKISLRDHQQLSERWVQDRIAEDPTILGLGDVILKDKERNQPRAGRLDLLLQEIDATRRYEVEIQLGKTDESHIIRTIEYWDIERKRYPQYDHTAVIVAEEITARFLNVISLFNGVIPVMAIQMSAVQLGDTVSLLFTTVLDQVRLGLVDEDEEVHEATMTTGGGGIASGLPRETSRSMLRSCVSSSRRLTEMRPRVSDERSGRCHAQPEARRLNVGRRLLCGVRARGVSWQVSASRPVAPRSPSPPAAAHRSRPGP